MNREGLTSDWLAENQADWPKICELLRATHYEQAAELLAEAQQRNELMGQTMTAEFLAVMRFLCLASSQCRAEVVWHERAYQKAGQREHELRQQLQAILDLLGLAGPVTVTLARPQPNPNATVALSGQPPEGPPASAGLWWQVQNPPGWNFRLAGPEALAGLASMSVQLVEQTKTPQAVFKSEQRQPDAFGLVIHCLGPFRVYRNGQPLNDWTSLKAQAIFKYLLTHQSSLIPKDVLRDVFWPQADSDAARRNLHQAIYSLRQTLKQGQPDDQPMIQFENDCYFLNPALSLWLDCRQFEQHVQTGQRLEASARLAEALTEYRLAEELYRGDFLEEDLYEDWASAPREHWRNMYLELADCLSEHYLHEGNLAGAMTLCEKILLLDNCNEPAHRRLMQCYQSQGQRHLAVRQYRQCVQMLKSELDVPPGEEIQSLYEKIMGNSRSLVLAT